MRNFLNPIYNNVDSSCPDVQVRKTKTTHPVDQDRRCPYQITVELREDDLWYLWKPRRHSAKAELSCMHKWHPKCNKEDMANISTRYMSQDERDELAKFHSSHISTSVSANLISSLSDFRWLPTSQWSTAQRRRMSSSVRSVELSVVLTSF